MSDNIKISQDLVDAAKELDEIFIGIGFNKFAQVLREAIRDAEENIEREKSFGGDNIKLCKEKIALIEDQIDSLLDVQNLTNKEVAVFIGGINDFSLIRQAAIDAPSFLQVKALPIVNNISKIAAHLSEMDDYSDEVDDFTKHYLISTKINSGETNG